MKTVTPPKVEEQSSALDPVLSTDGWQTLMTFTRESARTLICALTRTSCLLPHSAAAPKSSAPGGPSSSAMDVDDIPPEVFDQIAADDAARAGGSGGIKICPHCTFENDHSGGDCEVCGLPL